MRRNAGTTGGIITGENEQQQLACELCWDDVKYALSGYVNAHYDHLNVTIWRNSFALSVAGAIVSMFFLLVRGVVHSVGSVICISIGIIAYALIGICAVSKLRRENAIHHLYNHIEPEAGDSFVQKLYEKHDVSRMFDVRQLVDKEGYNLVRRILSSKHNEDRFLYDDVFQTNKFCNNCTNPH